MYVYKRTEFSPYELYTVGFYEPDGKWQPESDHEKEKDAADRVILLNGGKPQSTAVEGQAGWEARQGDAVENERFNEIQRLKTDLDKANAKLVRYEKDDFELLEEYDMKERLQKTIQHCLTKMPEENRQEFIVNLCNGMVGSAILHYRNKYVNKMNIKPFNQQMA